MLVSRCALAPFGRVGRGFGLVLAVFAGLAIAVPTVAQAEELAVVVERTTPTQLPVPIVVQSDRRGRVALIIYRIGNPQALLEAGVSIGNGAELAFLGGGRDANAARRKDAARARLARDADVKVAVTRRVGIPEAGKRQLVPVRLDAPGLYLVEVMQGRTVARATALVSDLALVVKREPAGLLAWAINRRTGKPWEGATLSAPQLPRPGSTNAKGLWRHEGALAPSVDLVVRAGQHLAFGSETYFPAEVTDRRVYAFPHQPAYRPGERVEVKGVVRAYDGAHYLLDPTVPDLTVQLIDARGQQVAETTASVSSDLGTFDVGFDLDSKAPTGNWKILVEVEGASYEAPLRVEAYRKPAFEVRVTPRDRRVLAGGSSAFEVDARFYDGGILGGAKVDWQVLFHRVDRTLFPTDELVRLFFGTEREAYRAETLATGTGVLDATGRLHVDVNAPDEAFDGHLTLRATVFGPDRLAVAGSGSIAVAAAPIRVALEADQHLYAPEDIARVEIRIERADGQAASGRTGTLTLSQVVSDTSGGASARRSEPRPFTTDGQGVAVLEVSLPDEGHFQMAVTVPRQADEGGGAPVKAHTNVWIAADRPTVGLAPETLDVVADKELYAPGDVARFLVRGPGAGRAVLAAVEGGRILQHEVLEPETSASVWSLAIEPAHAPNVFATFVTVFRGELMIETVMLRVPPVEQVLTTTLEPDVAALEPGSSTGVGVRVTDAAGQPVAGAEVSVSVIDAALFGLFPEAVAPIEAFFHAPRRNSVSTSGLLHHDSVGHAFVRRPPSKESAAPAASAGPAGGGACGSAGACGGGGGDGAPDPSAAAVPTTGVERGSMGDDSEGVDLEEALEEAEAEVHNQGLALSGLRLKKNGRAPAPALEARRDFRTCVFWIAALRTDAEGRARIDDVQLADSLTRWRISAKSVDAATRVGSGTAQIVARKKVAVSVTPPRFLRANDTVEVPVVARNLTDEDVTGTLDVWQTWQQTDIDAGHPRNGPTGTEDVAIPARGTIVRPVTFRAGDADAPNILRMIQATLVTGAGQDVEARTFPVLPQGIEKVEGAVMRATEGRAATSLPIPASAVPGTLTCTVSVESGTVEAIASALPYLIDYPHGCTEQTMNRFGPLLDVQAAVELLDIPTDRGRLAEIPTLVDAGVDQLNGLRHKDGGFGWWATDASDPAMTALVVRGLSRVLDQGVDHQVAEMLRHGGAQWLSRWLSAQGARGAPEADSATLASVFVALGAAGQTLPKGALEGAIKTQAGPLTRAWLLTAALAQDNKRIAEQMRGDLLAGAQHTQAHSWWPARQAEGGDIEGGPTRWQDDDIEVTAVVLLALLEAGHDDDGLFQRGADWLIDHRVGGDRWRSTRDTGAAVLFLSAYAATGDLTSGQTVRVLLDDALVGEVLLDRTTLFTQKTRVTLPGEAVVPGRTLELALEGKGRLTAGIALRYFEAGPAIRSASNGLTVERRLYVIEPHVVEGQTVWRRVPLAETVPSGTLLESEIVVQSDEAREFVMVGDPLAGGFEPERAYGMHVEGREVAADAHVERYDDATLFFVTDLPAGRTVLRHVVRATHVGSFTALPAQAELMYFPAVRGNSEGALIEVSDGGPVGQGGGK